MLMNGGVNAVKEIFDKYNNVAVDEETDNSDNSNIDSNIVTGYNINNSSINSSYYFDNRASEKKESSINWVYKAKIFSQVENKLFHQKISEINQGSQAFTKNLAGEYMLPIENKIVFTDGNYDSPYISEIIEVLTEYQTEFNKIKERIFNVERGESEKQDEVQIVRQMFGKGRVLSYNSEADGVYDWENGRRKGNTRRAVISNYLRKQERGGNDTKGKAAEVNKTDSSNKNATADNVDASKQFNKDIGADFSESALLMSQKDSTDTDRYSNESILTEPTVKKAEADPVRDSVFEFSGRQSYTPEQLKVVTVARKFGRKVVFEDTTKTQGFRSDGYFDSDGNIHLDYDTVKPLEWVLKHELTHFGEGTVEYDRCVAVLRKTKEYTRWLQKELNTIEDSLPLLEHAMREKYIAERERARAKARERGLTVPPPLNPNTAYDDIIADFLATFAFAKDSRGVEALTTNMSLKEHNVFMQWLIDAISYLKKKLGGSNKTLTYELSVLEDRYLKMLTYKAQNPTTENDSGNKYSISESIVDETGKDYDYWLDKIETISDEDALKTRSETTYLRIADSTPNILQKYGAMNLPLIIRFDAMYLAQRGNGVFEGHYHNLGKEVMGNLLDYVSNPDAILKTVTKNKKGDDVTKLVALVAIPVKSGEALASIEINTVKDSGKGDELYNLVVTFFDYKENYLQNLFLKYGAKIKYKKETLSKDNPKLHKWLGTIEESVSKNSIPQSSPNSQEKIAKQETKESNSENVSKNQYSIPTEADELLDRYESGEISRDEYKAELDELYNRAVDTFGPIKRGEKAQEEINVPRRVEKNKKTHRFVRTIIESDALTDEMLDDVML